MAGEWVEAKLGEVVELKRGYDLPQRERVPGPVPLVSSSGVTDYHSEAKVKGPGVVTGRYGTLGQIYFVAEDFWPLNTTLYVQDFKGSDPRFISYFLTGLDYLAYSDKAAVPGLNRNHLHQATVLFPRDVGEQRAIAHILGTLDDKIELNRRMSETLEAMARALFRSWFVDFDPVQARAEGRDPGLPHELADLFPARLVDSELGEIPEGWEVKPLGHWVDTLSGGTPSKAEVKYWSGNVPWISPKVMTAIHADETDAYVDESAIGNGTRLAPALSTLVMVRGMGLHESVRVSQARREVTFNQDVKALVGARIEPTLLLFALLDSQPALLERVESSGHGTGKLPSEVLLALPVTMPDVAAQERLSEPLRALNDRIASTRAESRTLAALRDALLPKLISGKLRVPFRHAECEV
jgi:type I restriction enzyme S subunit